MSWAGSLTLDYRLATVHGQARTVLRDRHDGPLRVLASLYPEDGRICHNVLVHPPGGLVAGDRLDITLSLQEGAHALITTPGATRFYRSTGEEAVQTVNATLAAGSRLEWLPLETIAYSGCLGRNLMRFELATGSEMIGWDLLALGLPAAGLGFDRGSFTQSIELPHRWLERGRIEAHDRLLLDSPLGWAGHRALATLWFAAGGPIAGVRREALLESARAAAAYSPLARSSGATAVDERVVVLRVLAPRVEPAMALLARVWAAWRTKLWELPAVPPRVWRT